MKIAKILSPVIVILLFASPSFGQNSVADYQRLIEAAQQPAENKKDSLTLNQLMDEFGVPGVSVAVIKDFEIHWAKGYGLADIENSAPVNTETVFQAASISKPVAAMAVLKAVQDGLFSLDEDINQILKSWQLDGKEFTNALPVTPRMLTSHTSGLGDGFGFPGYHPNDPRPTTVQILNGEKPSNVGDVYMERSPLTEMKYSGGGVTIMELALSDVVGRPFTEIARDYVLDPVGMTKSAYEQPISKERDKNAARAHNRNGYAMDAKWHVYPELAAAGLWTTPTDLAKFAIEVQKSVHGKSNKVLSRSMIQEMLNPVGVGSFAVGFSLAKEGDGWYFQHGGSNWGFRCLLVAHKIKGYGLAVMTNASRGGSVMNEIKKRVERVYKWDSLDKPVPR